MTTNRGYDENTDLYNTRYYAKKAVLGSEVVVHVCGGYKILPAQEYSTWKKQR